MASSSDPDRQRFAETVLDGAPLHTVAMKRRIAQRLFGTEDEPPRLGRFVVTGVLGSGGTGVVYAAFDPQLDRRVALKVLDPARVAANSERARLLREAQALAQLAHPHVVSVHQIDEHEGSLFVVMELVDGVALDRWQRLRPRSLREILQTFAQAGEGLAAAHACGLVHRDFKPANVLVGHDDRVRVVDFGLASRPEDRSHAPMLGSDPEARDPTRSTLAGTPAYMAPEQAAMRAANAQSDQFSFCVALWEAVEGSRPWTPAELLVLAERSAAERRALPVATRAPRWLARCLTRGLAVDPTLRFRSMKELLAELHARPLARRRRTLVAVASLGATGWAALTWSSAPPSCPASAPDLRDVWDSSRAGALEVVMREAAPFGEPAHTAIAQRIDEYAARWTDVRESICEATFTRGTASHQAFERGIACLERRRDALDVLVGILATADREALAKADAIVDVLPDPTPCRALDSDLAAAEPLEQSKLALQAADRAHLLAAAGQLDAARLAATAAATHAEQHEDLAAQVEVQLARGAVLAAAGDPKGASHDFLHAAVTAQRVAYDAAAARAWLAAADIQARELEDEELATLALDMARATLDRTDAGPLIRAQSLDVEATIAGLTRRLDVAAATRARAVELMRTAVSSDDPRLLTLERRMANDLALLEKYDEAQPLYEAVLTRTVERLGPNHPDVGSLELDLGLLARDRGRIEDAKGHIERAHALRRAAFGDESPRLARTLTALALLGLESGALADGERHARRAWELQRRHLPRGHSERGGALSLLAGIHIELGHYERSLAEHQELMGELEGEAKAEERTATENNIAWLLCRIDRCVEAEPYYRRVLDAEPPWPSYAEAGLAQVALAAGDAAAAVTRIEGVMPSVEALFVEGHQELRAELRWTLARAFADLGDTTRALEATTAALSDYRELGTRSDALASLAELERRLRAQQAG